MLTWTTPAFQLCTIATEHFNDLTEQEFKLMCVVASGEAIPLDPSLTANEAAAQPAAEIRAEVIEWLCKDVYARNFVTTRGIFIDRATVTEMLSIDCEIPFPLSLTHCTVKEPIFLHGADLLSLDLTGSQLDAIVGGKALGRSLRIKGLLSLDLCVVEKSANFEGANLNEFSCFQATFKDSCRLEGTHFATSISISPLLCANGFEANGVEINGNLDCSGAFCKSTLYDSLPSFSANKAKISGDVTFDIQFATNGRVSLQEARVGGDLSWIMAKNPGHSLDAKGIRATGKVSLSGKSEGEINFTDALIDGDLTCQFLKCSTDSKSIGGNVLVMERSRIGGEVNLSFFEANGPVSLVKATVAKDLRGFASKFLNKGRTALDCQEVNIGGDAEFTGLFEGNVVLSAAKIASRLSCNGDFREAGLDLRKAVAGSFADDPAKWPSNGRIWLDGFVYNDLTGPRDAQVRLNWLDRQLGGSFSLQPYDHLANVLLDAGDEDGATKVLIAMEDERRKRSALRTLAPLSRLYRAVAGYGYKPVRALVIVAVSVFAMGLLFACLYNNGVIVPTEKDAFFSFKQAHSLPNYYPRFNEFAFSLDMLFPLFNLGQKAHWGVTSGAAFGHLGFLPQAVNVGPFCRCISWLYTLAGQAILLFIGSSLARPRRIRLRANA